MANVPNGTFAKRIEGNDNMVYINTQVMTLYYRGKTRRICNPTEQCLRDNGYLPYSTEYTNVECVNHFEFYEDRIVKVIYVPDEPEEDTDGLNNVIIDD